MDGLLSFMPSAILFIQAATLAADLVLLAFILQQRSSLLRSLFAAYVGTVTAWSAFVPLVVRYQYPLWLHLVFAAAAVALTLQFLFIKAFPHDNPFDSSASSWIIGIGVLFFIASFLPDGVFSSFTVHNGSYAVIHNGYLSRLYSLFVITYILAPIVVLWRKSRVATTPRLREQLHYLLIGFVLFLGVNLFTNSVLPVFFHIYVFNALGPVFSLALAAAVFYIIWRYRFLDLKVVIARGIVYLFLVFLVSGSYFGVLTLLTQHGIHPIDATPFVAFTLLFVSGAVIYGVERYFEHARELEQERAHTERLEREVAERTQHLQDLQDYQRRMTSDIAHALQTPLTVLKGTLGNDMLDLSAARESVDRLSALMYALLRLSRLEALPAENHERFSLSDAVAGTAEYIGTVCAEHGIRLRQNIAPSIFLKGNRKQIEELLTNLVSNAVRYTQHAPKKEISVSLQNERGTAKIVVSDTGCGIAPEALPHIFERFYRAPDNAEPGTGLGLAIVKRIAELHGGTISAESTVGEGALFIVTFPLA